MTPDNLLADLGQRMGLPNLKFNEHGLCRLAFDTTILIDVERGDDPQSVHLYSVLAPIPAEGREALFERLLTANLFGHETGGATFGLDLLNNDIVLSRTLDTTRLDGNDFAAQVDVLVNAVENWSKQLAAAPESAASEAPTFAPPADNSRHAIRV